MSFNGSGLFVVNSSGQPVVANTLIQASVFNAFTADIATGLSTCITKDGQTTVTADIPMNSHKITGLAAGAVAGDALRYEQVATSAALAALVTDETGSGALVFATSPTLVTPILGTPTSGTLTNCTGLPVATGISGLGAGVATFLATPSSANLAAAITNETGTAGALVFSASPTFTGTANFAALTASGSINSSDGTTTTRMLSTGGSGFLGTTTNHPLTFQTNATDKFVMTADGRFYGSALHNNAGAVTGTTNQYIASGTYTPTIANLSNVASSSGAKAQWMRVGNVVTVSGYVLITPTANTTFTEFSITLPIASDIALGTLAGAGGTWDASAVKTPSVIVGDAVSNLAYAAFTSTGTSGIDYYFSFTYLIA